MQKETAVKNEIKRRYYLNAKKMYMLLAVCLAVMFFAVMFAISIGSSGIPVSGVWGALRSRFMASSYPIEDEVSYNIVWELRLPRILMAILAGAGLSVSGVVMQALTRNPLVSPFTIGISNAAAFGASVVILYGARFAGSGQMAITVGAFSTATLCVTLVYAVSSKKGLNAITIVLTGTTLTYLFSALTNTTQYIANVDKLAAVVHWSFGSFSSAGYGQIVILFFALLFCLPVFMRNSWGLDALSSGDDEVVRGLGIDAKRSRILLGLMAVFLTSCIVSFCGVIGFVGIVGPHIARLLIGPNHKFLLPFSSVFGGLLVLAADTIGRTLMAPIIIPVGIVLAYIGVPIFLQLILSRKEMYFK